MSNLFFNFCLGLHRSFNTKLGEATSKIPFQIQTDWYVVAEIKRTNHWQEDQPRRELPRFLDLHRSDPLVFIVFPSRWPELDEAKPASGNAGSQLRNIFRVSVYVHQLPQQVCLICNLSIKLM